MYLSLELEMAHSRELEEKKRTIYRSPLPRKKQRCSYDGRGRPCKVRHYTKEEIDAYQYEMATNRG